jgi:hypothetical protein
LLDFRIAAIFEFFNTIGRKADVEIGSRGSEMDVTDVVRFLRERCPKLDVGGEAIGEFLRSGSTALRISDGVRWAACPPGPLCVMCNPCGS